MSNILDNFDENFPDWTNPELGVDGMTENILKAEEKQKTAKENIFGEMIRIAKETLAAAPEFLQHAPFLPGDDLFLLRGMPLDGILGGNEFDLFNAVANGGDDVFSTRVYVVTQGNPENIGMYGVLVWSDETGTERAWVNGRWEEDWDMGENGPKACRECEHMAACPEYIASRIRKTEMERMDKLEDKLYEKFPKLQKFLDKNHAEIVLTPSEDSPAIQAYMEAVSGREGAAEEDWPEQDA